MHIDKSRCLPGRRRLAQCLLVVLCCAWWLVGCQGSHTMRRSSSSPGIYHHVKSGQTLWSISRAYRVTVAELRRANRLSKSDVIRIGQRLYIPGAKASRRVASRCPCGPDGKRLKKGRGTQPDADSNPASEHAGGRFLWPLHGTLTRGFQPRGSQRHDGIDLAAPKGTPILAVEAGKVIFSDWGPGGYGRLVIIRHADNLVTVYAHNEKNVVRTNQNVKRGDVIATVGRSGRATGYHLHFEVRRKTVPVSPYKYLKRQRQVAVTLQSPSQRGS